MKRLAIVGTLLAVLVLLASLAVAGVAYATHRKSPTPPPPSASVSLKENQFVIGVDTYGGGHTWDGVDAQYTWTLTNNDRTWHIFEVKDITDPNNIVVLIPETTILKAASQVFNFPVASGLVPGHTYKIYCDRHQPKMVLYLTVPTPSP